MMFTSALMLGSILSALIGSVTTYVSNATNARSQELINQQNIQAQKDINAENIAYSKEFAQNGISWKVEDLQNAGLNPTLAAGMSGNVSQPTALSAPQAKAPMIDLSGISNAITAANNMMLTSYLMNDRNDVLREKNNVLQGLYQRKGAYFESNAHAPFIGSSKQLAAMRKAQEDAMSPESKAEWDKMMKSLAHMPKKFNWK